MLNVIMMSTDMLTVDMLSVVATSGMRAGSSLESFDRESWLLWNCTYLAPMQEKKLYPAVTDD